MAHGEGMIVTYQDYHLGDDLIHLHFLRQVAINNPKESFLHYASVSSLPQVGEMVAGIPNLSLSASDKKPKGAINAWRGAEDYWYKHPKRNDFVAFHLEWFELLAKKMGVSNPIKTRQDMLFNYPSLLTYKYPKFDVLVINCEPKSGQFKGYNELEIGAMARKLELAGHKVTEIVSLEPWFSITQIGAMSLFCHTIVAVSSGPSWTTWNRWNQDTIKHRILFLDHEKVELDDVTEHTQSVHSAEAMLGDYGLL